ISSMATKIININETEPDKMSTIAREWCYNALDTIITRQVLDPQLPQFDTNTQATYDFSRALQAPALEMRLRGVLIDPIRKAEVIDEFYDKIEILERNLERIVLRGD